MFHFLLNGLISVFKTAKIIAVIIIIGNVIVRPIIAAITSIIYLKKPQARPKQPTGFKKSMQGRPEQPKQPKQPEQQFIEDLDEHDKREKETQDKIVEKHYNDKIALIKREYLLKSVFQPS